MTSARMTHRLISPATARAGALVRRWRSDLDRAADAATSSDGSLARYDALLAEEASACDVPSDLLRAICWYASGWRQFEPGGRVLTTPTPQGVSYGCMQLNDHWHPDAFPAATSDARASIRYAANLLHWLHEQTGSWNRATVAFFGHDGRAELAARRVRRYARETPWEARLERRPAPLVAETLAGIAPTSSETTSSEDLYADLAL